MAEYRAYILGLDGKIRKAIPLFCDEDEFAKEKAKQLIEGHDIELWQRDGKIAKFNHKAEWNCQYQLLFLP
jgi:hypothetical protein